MNAKQKKKLLVIAAATAGGWWLLARSPAGRPPGYPYMGQAGGAGPGQTGSGGRSPGQ